MAFKRYDKLYSKELQEHFDNEMPACPFCGEYPHWLLDLKSGFTKGTVTCMCEKCGAKLYTEGTVKGWSDDLRVTDTGSKNINNLTLNSTYHINALGNMSARSAAGGDDFFDAPGAPVGAAGVTDASAADAQGAAPMPGAPAAAAQKKPLYKNKVTWLVASGLILMIVLFAVLFGMHGCSVMKENQKKTFAEDAARQLISQTLVAPSSARWKDVSYLEDNGEQYIVYVDVEAQNAFGVYLRNSYFVIVYNIDVDKKTFSYNSSFYCVECSGKNDSYNLALIKSLNNYDGEAGDR